MNGGINELVRRAYFYLVALAAALASAACGSTEPQSPPGPAYEIEENMLTYWTEAGLPVTTTVENGGIAFEIEDASGNRFGMRFEPGGFAEWSVQDGKREELSLESWDDLGGEVYRYNGRAIALTRSQVEAHGSFDAAVNAVTLGKVSLGETSLYNNELGNQLAASFSTTLAEIVVAGEWANEDGTCSSDLTLAATACTKLKCTFFGGLANVLCNVCIGVTTVCVFMAVVSLFGGA